jgi:5-methylcytosine-specific restriction endonuclease McrA
MGIFGHRKSKPWWPKRMMGIIRKSRREKMYDNILETNGIVRCQICHQPMSRKKCSLEHIIPQSLGGTDASENLTLTHKKCNSRRGTKPLALVTA